MSTDTSTIPLKQRLAARGLDGLTLLVLPAVLFLLALFIYPFFYGLFLSFERIVMTGTARPSPARRMVLSHALAGVAVDVGRCADHRDQSALSATLARLMRVGRRSLTEIWDGADMAG